MDPFLSDDYMVGYKALLFVLKLSTKSLFFFLFRIVVMDLVSRRTRDADVIQRPSVM